MGITILLLIVISALCILVWNTQYALWKKLVLTLLVMATVILIVILLFIYGFERGMKT